MQTTKLTKKTLPALGKIWWPGRRSRGPNWERVRQIGTHLDVDAILTYGMEEQEGTDKLWAHLLDVLTGRTYTAGGTTYYFQTEGYGELARLTTSVLLDFRAHREQRRAQ